MSSSATSTYQTLPDDIGTPTNPIRLPFNVVKFHIKKTADKKDFVLGNSIVTNRYASNICMITNIVPNNNPADTLKVTLHDGTYDLRYSIVSKSLIPPEIWAKLCDCSLDDANNWIKDSTPSHALPQSLSQYQTSSNYPIIIELVFQLGIYDNRTGPSCNWCSCKLSDDYALPEKKITEDSEEWYNIVWKENIEKSATFYKDYCLTSSQKLSLQTNIFQPPYGYHPIFDNPCYPIPMTCTNMWDDTKPTTTQQQDGKQQPKLFYYDRDITNRIAYITVYVANNTTPCPNTPQCSADCKYVKFKDNSASTILSHLTKYPPKGSTCIDFSRLNVNLVDDRATTSAQPVLASTIGEEGYKNQTLLDEHQAKALQVIEEIKAIGIQTKEYITSLRTQYHEYHAQIQGIYNTMSVRLSTHPLFATLIEPLQKQLEDVITKSKEEYQQFDTAEQLNDVLDWNNVTSDLLMNCKQILDTLLNTNIALYNDFYDYYLPHLDEQLHHLQQQMELSLLSHHNTATTQYTSNNNHTNDIIINNTTNTNNLLPFTYQLNRLNNYHLCSTNSTTSSSYYNRRPHIAPPCEYVVSTALQSLIHQQQEHQHNTTTSLSTMTDDVDKDNNNNNNINNNNNTVSQYHYDLLARHLATIAQNVINMNAEKEATLYNIVEQHQAIIKERDNTIKEKDNTILDNKIALQQQQTIIQAKDEHISQLTYQKLTLTKDHQNEIATTKQQYETQIAVSKQTTESLAEQITFLKQQLATKDDQLATKDKQIELLLTKH